jgi:flagellar basal-body rod protein FlgG
MQSGFYSATGGMVAQFNKLDSTTNNLANLNTAGFKRDELIFGDYMKNAQGKRDELPLENNSREGSKFFNRSIARVPQVVDEYTDFKVGALEQTDSPLDMAITEDDIFFAVNTPNGKRLTKNGSFNLNSEGLLVTKEGFEILNTKGKPIKIAVDREFQIDKNGMIRHGLDDVDRIMTVRPENLRTLVKEGDNLLKMENEDQFIPVLDSFAIQQGYVEKSNVNAVLEMSSLIEVNRMVGMYQKVMDTQMNEINRDAIEKLGSTRA